MNRALLALVSTVTLSISSHAIAFVEPGPSTNKLQLTINKEPELCAMLLANAKQSQKKATRRSDDWDASVEYMAGAVHPQWHPAIDGYDEFALIRADLDLDSTGRNQVILRKSGPASLHGTEYQYGYVFSSAMTFELVSEKIKNWKGPFLDLELTPFAPLGGKQFYPFSIDDSGARVMTGNEFLAPELFTWHDKTYFFPGDSMIRWSAANQIIARMFRLHADARVALSCQVETKEGR